MEHVYGGNIYLDSNGDTYLVEKEFLSKNAKTINLSQLAREMKAKK